MKQFFKHNKKLMIAALCLGLAATVVLQATVLAQECYQIRDKVVRLHILANSDSKEDQDLKLKVRNALLFYAKDLFSTTVTKEQAMEISQSYLKELERVAEITLRQQGCGHSVTCSLEQTYFNTRVYDNITLPAGEYTALRVIIGEGAGQNWWCVMFPPLCIPAAEAVTANPDPLNEVLSEQEQDLVENGPKYEIKFKAVEWFQRAAEQWKEWF